MFICLNCGKENKTSKNTMNMYCDNACQADKQSRDIVNGWLASPSPGSLYHKGNQIRKTIRRFLLVQAAYACSLCGWDKRHPEDGASTLEVDHINGDWCDCAPSNLRVICPNCHSLTPNYKGRNKGNGRGYRKPQD